MCNGMTVDFLGNSIYDAVRMFVGWKPPFGNVVHYEISRKDNKKMCWEEQQEAKTQIIGDIEAIMIFPQKSNTINNANAYHFYVLEMDLPFSLDKTL